MFKRLKRLYQLSQKDPEALKKLEGLSDEQLVVIPEAGDGKAVFFSEGSEQEFKDQEKADKGLKGIFGL